MSYLSIVEHAVRSQAPGADWYAPEGHGGSVHLLRGDAALADHVDTTRAGNVVTRWTGVRIGHGGTLHKGSMVFALKYPVPLEFLYEFDAWFQAEHMPMLLEEPTWYGFEFFRALGASCYTFAALHYLEPQALTSDARNRSIDTPWWHRLKRNDWFDQGFVRWRMRRL